MDLEIRTKPGDQDSAVVVLFGYLNFGPAPYAEAKAHYDKLKAKLLNGNNIILAEPVFRGDYVEFVKKLREAGNTAEVVATIIEPETEA
jgi:hypothetical protein